MPDLPPREPGSAIPILASRPVHIRVLWARCEEYPYPQFVAALSSSLDEGLPEVFDEEMARARAWYLGLADNSTESWTFWTTQATVPEPEEGCADARSF